MSSEVQDLSICVCSPSEQLLESTCDQLGAAGFRCLPAEDPMVALRLCRYARVELLIIDLAFGGAAVTEQILERVFEADFPEVGRVLALTEPAKHGRDLATLLEAGRFRVDDDLAKPFSSEELLVRVGRIVRPRHDRAAGTFHLGDVTVDPDRHRVMVGEREVELTRKEFALLQVLAKDPTGVFSKDELLRAVWGETPPKSRSRTVDSHASRLRGKLDPEQRRFVVNCWGIGYRLVESMEKAVPGASGGEGR